MTFGLQRIGCVALFVKEVLQDARNDRGGVASLPVPQHDRTFDGGVREHDRPLVATGVWSAVVPDLKATVTHGEGFIHSHARLSDEGCRHGDTGRLSAAGP